MHREPGQHALMGEQEVDLGVAQHEGQSLGRRQQVAGRVGTTCFQDPNQGDNYVY